jgi:chromosomal replication initiator protein
MAVTIQAKLTCCTPSANTNSTGMRKTRITILSAEQFCNAYIQALEDNKTQDFRKKYQVEFLAGKERLQEDIFHIFLQLAANGTQIVMACNCSDTRCLPPEIQVLEQRLVSRFEWGQTADLAEAPNSFTARIL